MLEAKDMKKPYSKTFISSNKCYIFDLDPGDTAVNFKVINPAELTL